MAAIEKVQDDYVLGRNVAARSRLNHQHFFYSKVFGYLLHPNIPHDRENLRVADVATGSGIWLLDIMSSLSPSTQFHGFDIDLSQIPPKAWLPPNLAFSKLDLFADLPKELEGAFDIINVRLLVLVVKDNDPAQILQKLRRMLKPGGWLQWTEPDLTVRDLDLVKADQSLSHVAIKEFERKFFPKDARFKPIWPTALAECFRVNGFDSVEEDVKTYEDFLPWLAFMTDVAASTYEELISRMPSGPNKDEMQLLYNRALVELWHGTAWPMTRINVVGRRSTA